MLDVSLGWPRIARERCRYGMVRWRAGAPVWNRNLFLKGHGPAPSLLFPRLVRLMLELELQECLDRVKLLKYCGDF